MEILENQRNGGQVACANSISGIFGARTKQYRVAVGESCILSSFIYEGHLTNRTLDNILQNFVWGPCSSGAINHRDGWYSGYYAPYYGSYSTPWSENVVIRLGSHTQTCKQFCLSCKEKSELFVGPNVYAKVWNMAKDLWISWSVLWVRVLSLSSSLSFFWKTFSIHSIFF